MKLSHFYIKKLVKAHNHDIFLSKWAIYLWGDLNHCPKEEEMDAVNIILSTIFYFLLYLL